MIKELVAELSGQRERKREKPRAKKSRPDSAQQHHIVHLARMYTILTNHGVPALRKQKIKKLEVVIQSVKDCTQQKKSSEHNISPLKSNS